MDTRLVALRLRQGNEQVSLSRSPIYASSSAEHFPRQLSPTIPKDEEMASLPVSKELESLQLPVWRSLFKTKSQMDSSPMKFPIKGFLPEGITFIGGLSESGKTWFALSMAKAISTGKTFLGRFQIGEPATVLYLVPESGERAFRQRMEIMGIPDNERFMVRTMSDGPIRLDHPDLLEAVRHLKPVIFLDTLVRFNDSENENDASQSAHTIAKDLFALLKAGAKAIVCLHHSRKDAGGTAPSLENTLRGSGDLGAMADAVYSLRVEDHASLKVRVTNVKARDFEPVPAFVIEGRPSIGQRGDFQLLSGTSSARTKKPESTDDQSFLSAITANPNTTYDELDQQFSIKRAAAQRAAKRLGYRKLRNSPWTKTR